MAEPIRAKDLMRTGFAQIRTDQTLGEAMAALRDAQDVADLPNALMVVDAEGRYAGMLTAKLLIRLLVCADEAHASDEAIELLSTAQARLAHPVGTTPIPGIGVVTPEDRLLTIIRRGVATRLDFVPVVAEGRPVGFVPITEIFQSAAAIALTPEHEGIRFDR